MNNAISFFKQVGPGFVIAATGVGAGDLVAAAVGGAQFGTVILWASALGALLKFVLNEGVARWQLITGKTIISGWVQHFHKFLTWYFFLYLSLWSFIVAGALMASCGLAAHAFFPQISVAGWGCIHSILGVILVIFGRYRLLEQLMKFFVGLMFLTVVINLFLTPVHWNEVVTGLVIPTIPVGGTSLILGIIGGVGGSVTLLCYGYWIREKGWEGPEKLGMARMDLGISYFLTGLFGIAMILLAAGVNPEMIQGSQMVVGLADKLGETSGVTGKWIFMIGFWGAVFSSLLGVWNGVPYLFHDLYHSWKGNQPKDQVAQDTKSYRFFLLFMAFPPMLLLVLNKPIWIIIVYAVAGAFFMPLLATMLLLMNGTKRWLNKQKNQPLYTMMLIISLLLFLYLLVDKVSELLS